MYLKNKLFLWALVLIAQSSFTEAIDAQKNGKMDFVITKNDDGKFSVQYEIAHNTTVGLSSRKPNRIEGTDWYLVHHKAIQNALFAEGCFGASLLALVGCIMLFAQHAHNVPQPNLIDVQ
jgi:hypothetical protein